MTKWRRRIIVYRTRSWRGETGEVLGGEVYTLAMKSEDFLRLLECRLDYDAWPTSPVETDPGYFRAWQLVSVALQRGLRKWSADLYFRDARRFEDRQEAYTMVIYSTCRAYYGRPRTEFTYDVADAGTLPGALKSIGSPIERTLAKHNARLCAEGRVALARRYSPVWYQDILNAVKQRPKPLIRLIAREARLIDAVIDLGTRREETSARRLAKIANGVLRNLHEVDMRELFPGVLQETTAVLMRQARKHTNSMNHGVDRRIFEDANVGAAGRPDGGVGGEKYGDGRHAGGGGEMRDPGIVADIHARGGEPGG